MALMLLQLKRRCDLLHCRDIVPCINSDVLRMNPLFPLSVTEQKYLGLDHSEELKCKFYLKEKA